MESGYVRTKLLVFLLGFLTLVIIEVKGTDVSLSDDNNNDFTDGQDAYIIQSTNHTFQCFADSKDAVITWQLDSTLLPHSDGYPLQNASSTTSQTSIYSDLDITNHQLTCRVVVLSTTIIEKHVELKVQVPPESVIIYDSTRQTGYPNSASVTVTQDLQHILNCKAPATSKIPACDVTWDATDVQDLQGTVISTRNAYRQDNRLSDEIASLMFTPQRSHHRMLLECSASLDVPNIGIFPPTPPSKRVVLQVSGPPNKPYIDGPFSTVEGQTFSKTCRALDAYPATANFNVQWYLDGTDITNHADRRLTGDPNIRYNLDSTLTYAFSREHNQQDLKCSATHSTLSSPLESDIHTMDVRFCPSSVRMSYNNVQTCPTSLVAGDTLTLTCKSSTSNPKSTIKWYVDGKEHESDHTPVYKESDYHGWSTELMFTSPPVTDDDANIDIKCCAVTEGVCSDEICSDSCKPDVYYAPIFKTIFVPQDKKQEGDSALLTCDVDAVPTPEGFVKWHKDGTSIGGSFDSEKNRLLYNIGSLTRQDAGSYHCVANNGIGKSSSEPQNLTVIYAPHLTDNVEQKRSKSVHEGDRVELRVTIQSNPISDVQWTTPAGPVNTTADDRYEIETTIVQPNGYEDKVRGTTIRATLIIISASGANDTGQFMCIVYNSEGDLDVSFMIGFSDPPFLIIIVACSSVAGVIALIAAVVMIKSCKRKHCCSDSGERKKSTKSFESDYFPEDHQDEGGNGNIVNEYEDHRDEANEFGDVGSAYVNTPMGSVTDVRMPPSPSPARAVGSPNDLYDADKPVPPSPIPFPRLHSTQSPKTSPKPSPKHSPMLPKKANENMYTSRDQTATKYEERAYDPVTIGIPDVIPMSQM